MKVSKFDRSNISALRNEINSTLSQLAAKYGIKIEAGSASFLDSEVTFKLKCTTTNEDGEAAPDPKLSFYGKAYLNPSFDASAVYKHSRLGDVKFVKYRPTAKAKWAVKQLSTGKLYAIDELVAKAITR